MQRESFFIRHMTSIIIIIVAVFVAVGLLIWLSSLEKLNTVTSSNPSASSVLTDDQIQSLREAGTATTGRGVLNASQQADLNKNGSASGPEVLTPAQKAALMNQGSAK